MNQPSTEPEYTVETSKRGPHQEILPITNLQEVEAELALLSREVGMSIDILERIRDSVDVLQRSVSRQV